MRRYLPIAIVLVVVCSLYAAGALEFVEHRLMDLRFRLDDRGPSEDLVLVAIDPRSIRELDVWPWARGLHATVLENLIEAGARTVAFDVDFSSRSDVDEDRELAQAISRSGGRVILPVFEHLEEHAGQIRPITTRALPALRRHARQAAITVRPGRDGLVRRYRLHEQFEAERLPTLAAALAGSTPSAEEEFYIDYAIDADRIPRISYVDVLTGEFDQSVIAGRAVIIGATALEAGDIVSSPMGKTLPGPVLQALAFESIKSGRALERAGGPFTAIVALLLATLFATIAESLTWRRGLILLLAFSFSIFFVSLWVQQSAALMLDISPWILVTIGCFASAMAREIDQQDLTLLLQNVRLHQTESLMSHVVASSFDAIMTLDKDGTIEMFNPAAEKMFGIEADGAVGRHIDELIAPAEAQPGEQPEVALWSQEGQYEAIGRRGDDTLIPLELAVSSFNAGDRERWVGIVRDISEHKAQRKALQHQATHDALTNLPNRILLSERIEEEVQQARANGWSVAFLLLDLDGFREINDTLGHHIGDELLKQIALRLQDPLHSRYTIARLGGDEFAVVMPETELDAAVRMAERLCQTLAKPFLLRKLSLHVATSVGVSVFPDHGMAGAELIQRADVAMYMAKKRRTGIAIYDPEKDYNSIRHLTLNGQLRRAIEQDQLELYYQPKICIETGRVTSVEALVRWHHPSHGMVPPDDFIRLAEHTGLIIPLTHWVLGNALGQCLRWRAEGHEISVAVNISARNLQEKALPYELSVLLETCQLPPKFLTLEVTESVVMEDPEQSMALLGRLHALGVNISINDFGTGYSSLAYLKRLPATELKIDRSFVMTLDNENEDSVIVRSTIEMAHNLGLRVVAEGIETQRAWAMLKSFGCDYGQGYLFGRPAPAAAIQPLLGQIIEPATATATATEDQQKPAPAQPVAG